MAGHNSVKLHILIAGPAALKELPIALWAAEEVAVSET